MKDFNYCAPTRVIFGKNTELEVGKALKNAGATRVLMQYGGGSIKKSGLYDRVVKAIRDEGIELFELGGVQPNPHLSLVRKAIEIVREQKIDYLLAAALPSIRPRQRPWVRCTTAMFGISTAARQCRKRLCPWAWC